MRRTYSTVCFTGLFALVSLACQAQHAAAQDGVPMRATYDERAGRVDLFEGDRIILSYQYRTASPPAGLLDKVAAPSRKYARARSDYIHPLYGPAGEVLSDDWSPDHPHHRGIYWAWPEVDYRGERADLHALQRVFARPTGKLTYRGGSDVAQIRAESNWLWEDRTPIVRETATIRAYRSNRHGRYIDLTFEFVALRDDVSLARRGTTKYGGLNFRLAHLAQLEIDSHTDPPAQKPRAAWAEISGIPSGSSRPVAVTIFQHRTNPLYPGDWVDFPHLPWLQPTFPSSGMRYVLRKDKSLTLKYRLWVHDKEPLSEADYRAQQREYESHSPP